MIGKNREGLGRQSADKIARAYALISAAEEAVTEMSRAIEEAESSSLVAGGQWKPTLPAPLQAAHASYLDGGMVEVEPLELPEFMDKPL